MKKRRLKPWVKDVIATFVISLIVVFGIIVLNARFKQLNQQKNAIDQTNQIANVVCTDHA